MCAGDKQIQVMAYVRVSGYRLLARHLQKTTIIGGSVS